MFDLRAERHQFYGKDCIIPGTPRLRNLNFRPPFPN